MCASSAQPAPLPAHPALSQHLAEQTHPALTPPITPQETPIHDELWSGAWWGGNLLQGLPQPRPGQTLLCWSGWYEDDPAGIATWSNKGWEALIAELEKAIPIARDAGSRITLRPHARTILSDPQRCIAITAKFNEPTLAIALDPLAMLTPDMSRNAGDHVRRAFEGLTDHARLDCLILPDDDQLESLDPPIRDQIAVGRERLDHLPILRREPPDDAHANTNPAPLS